MAFIEQRLSELRAQIESLQRGEDVDSVTGDVEQDLMAYLALQEKISEHFEGINLSNIEQHLDKIIGTGFEEVGLDGIDTAECCVMIEEAMGVVLKDECVNGVNTPLQCMEACLRSLNLK